MFLCLFHRAGVFTTARRAVALGAMKQDLLRRFHVGFLALPDFQSGLLDGIPAKKSPKASTDCANERRASTICETFVAGGIALIHRQQPFVIGNQFAGSIY